MSTTIEQLTDVFRQVFDDPEIILSPETTANDVDGWDSLSHINLILSVENHFGIRFSQREVTRLKDVGELIRLIDSKLPQIS